MTSTVFHDVQNVDVSQSFISKLHCSISKGLPHAEPVRAFETSERELVRGVLQMLQGLSSSVFYWDEYGQEFRLQSEIYASHMSQDSLDGIVSYFAFGGSCLRKVEILVNKVGTSCKSSPTLKAFTNSVRSWLKRLRDIALKEEVKLVGSDSGKCITLLGLTSPLSSLCSGAEQLLQIVHGAISNSNFDSEASLRADELAVHILDHLFKKLNEVCLVQGGEEDAYHMLLAIFAESLLPYLEVLDTWLYEGILDDPYEEMFFYSNNTVSIDQPSFWETSYLLRQSTWSKPRSGGLPNPRGNASTMQVKRDASVLEAIPITKARGRDRSGMDIFVCPVFLKDMARAIISAGKSLQLVRHVRNDYVALFDKGNGELHESANHHCEPAEASDNLRFTKFEDECVGPDCRTREYAYLIHEMNHTREMGVLTLSEVFLLSLVGLVGDGDHIYEFFRKSFPVLGQTCRGCTSGQHMTKCLEDNIHPSSCNKTWFKFLTDVISERRHIDCFSYVEDGEGTARLAASKEQADDVTTTFDSFFPRNPIINVCREFLLKNKECWTELNITRNFSLPPLNDENLRKAIFDDAYNEDDAVMNRVTAPKLTGTNYASGFQFNDVKHVRQKNDTKTLETLYPFPTLLPCFQEDLHMSELLPFQKNSTLASRILNWIQSTSIKDTSQPVVIVKECVTTYVKKQAQVICYNNS